MKKRVVCFFKHIFFILLAVISFNSLILPSFGLSNVNLMASSNVANSSYLAFPRFVDLIKNFFESPFKNKEDINYPDEYVYLGGFPIGIAIESDGVVVIAKGTVTTKTGEVNTTFDSDIKVGDIITSICQEKISSTADIALFFETKYNGENKVDVCINRNGQIITTHVYPAFDVFTHKYRLGLWVRDTATGVGTMTFIKEDGGFSALGHPISDIDTASKIDVKSGNIFKCNIIGAQKGAVGAPGELRGLFLKNGTSIGSVSSNTNFGLKGTLNSDYLNNLKLQKVKVGRKGTVKTGKAKIISTIDGVVPEEFDVEIVKATTQNNPETKSMIIHVTDKRLLEKTGGIVQGMSGSPIMQDGKIIGAVTHVLVNDPTRGYGLYMDWMLE